MNHINKTIFLSALLLVLGGGNLAAQRQTVRTFPKVFLTISNPCKDLY